MTLSSRSSAAFSLVEVALALGIAGFCLVAIFGLLPVGVNTNAMTIMQTAAASAAASVVADLRATPKATSVSPAPVSPLFAMSVPAQGDGPANSWTNSTYNHTIFLRGDGSLATATITNVDKPLDTTQDPIFRVTVSFYPPQGGTSASGGSSPKQRKATTARVVVSWPAVADPDYKKMPANFTGTIEAVTALDRN